MLGVRELTLWVDFQEKHLFDRCFFFVKVLAQYYAVTNEHHKSEEELLVIFNKKISKNPTLKLVKDKVKLSSF